MKLIFSLVYLMMFGSLLAQTDAKQIIIADRVNSKVQQQKPYIILISVDGFRYDYSEKYQAKNLLQLSDQGVKAQSMIPSFPTLTFPNHYSIASGLYPSHHGLVNNNFYDRKLNTIYTMSDRKKVRDSTYYGGTPIWVLAEQQKMLTASLYWVGTEAPIKGIYPTYYYAYNDKDLDDIRTKTVVNWLRLPEAERPHLISVYYPEVDHDGHTYGPDANETKKAVQHIDSCVKVMVDAVAELNLPVNFIIVSDHGMTNVDVKKTVQLPVDIDTSKFLIPSEGNLLELYAKNEADILPTYQKLKRQEEGYKVYLKANAPLWWHYGFKDDDYNRIGDILVVPEWPSVFNLRNKNISPGWHGFDAYLMKDMHAIFYGWGPAFKKGVTIPAFENVHLYPLIAEILGLQITDKIDGDIKVLKPTLQ